ncbi:TonB-dependent receptor [Sphingomonas sp.]|uniref:TonB-dependent receptor n=1 Tax=Sphingomonas sp. TaxID=28214 RepID=UPI002DBBB2BB|nr:TonB-dependent receptor [Sphingomonas sp.]HEU4967415.1 TonB-dependent receptor [Sphingomonas sp.]
MKTVRILCGGTAMALTLAAAPAAAQPPASAQTAAANSEDIVVTAQKREQLLIDVPQSISVVSGAALEEQHANNFSDYLKLVPGLQLNQSTPGQGRLLLRGINTGGVASTVSVYVDETPFGSSSGLVNGAILAGDFDTFDVARVEVLRGPQGTLYGASSLGGVLKFVTNAPQMESFELRGRASVEAVDGGDTSYAGNAVVNIPLGSTLAFRASGTYRKDGGFIDSIGTAGSDVEKNINDARIYGGRASLLFTPSHRISVRATAILQDIKADAPSTVEADPFTLKPLYGRLSLSQFVPQFTDIRYRIYNGTADFDLGFANLTSSTSYATQDETLRSDVTANLSAVVEGVFGAPNELFLAQQTNDEKFTQELRLSDQTDAFDWLIGGYYTHEKGEILQEYVPVEPGTFTRITTLPLLAQVSLHSVYEEIAWFANATLHLGERFDIDFGGRYSHNRQHANQVGDGALAGGPTNNIASSSENVFTYSVAPKLKFDDNVSVYARVAKGFRPGGPNVLPPSAPAGTPATYDSDSVISYEAGVKAQTPDNDFSIDFALYHIDWNHIQLFAIVNNFGVNTNGGSAKSDGAEFTVTVRPTAGLNLALNGAFTNARLTADSGPLVGGLKGDRLPFTPKYSAALNGDYRWSLAGSTEAYIGGSVRLVGDQPGAFDATFRAANGRQREVPSYSVVDLRAGLDFGRFGVEAYVKNLGNSHGITSTSAVQANGFDIYPNGAIGTGIIRPRTIGLSLTAQY